MKALLFLVLIAVFPLTCVARDDVRANPDATYTASAWHGSLTGSWPRAEQDAVATAKKYCASRKELYVFISEARSGAYGLSPQRVEITFQCAQDAARIAAADCNQKLKDSALDPIRDKVELQRSSADDAVPFTIATNDNYPTDAERLAIAKWATVRESCIKESEGTYALAPSATPLQSTVIAEIHSFDAASTAKISELIVDLYERKLSYSEFAAKRYEFSRDAAAAKRQFILAAQMADQEQRLQAQEMAQQEFQTKVMAWASYIQAVNSRTPQTAVTVQQSVTIR